MRTLAFCTSYSAWPHHWRFRYRRWLDAIRRCGLRYDLLMLFDDGSPLMPEWDDIELIHDIDAAPATDTAMLHFPDRLGRPEVLDYPGWYRSFTTAGLYAERHGFDRVVHIESDAYLISQRAIAWANDLVDGWEAPYCPRIRHPETAIQVATGSGMAPFLRLCHTPYSAFAGRNFEPFVPFTTVRHDLIGNRYLSDPVPPDADWGAQIHGGHPQDYFWWLETAP